MKKQKGNDREIVKMFLILFLILIIAFGTGYFIRSKARPKILTEESNGFVFQKTEGTKFWYTSMLNPFTRQEFNVDFRYSPSEVKNISVIGDPINFFRLLKQGNLTGAYITFDLEGNVSYATALTAADMSKLLKVMNGITLVAACTSNSSEVCHKRPIVTCENQEDRAIVVYVKESIGSKITMQRNCLTVEGDDEELVRAYTKLLFIWYSII